MPRRISFLFINCHLLFFRSREYADEALKQGKIFTEVAKEKLEDVAAETIKSK
jgi:hypothetical protein